MGYTIIIIYISILICLLLEIEFMGALLFPGQGSQFVGMGSEFFNNFKTVKNIFDRADTKL